MDLSSPWLITLQIENNKKQVCTAYMRLVQVQKDLLDLSKHLISLDKAECFALEKKKNKQNSYIVVR